MTSAISRGISQYVASEAHTLINSRLYKADNTKRPVVYFTGGPGDDRDFLTSSASGKQIAPRLAEVGVALISAQFGGAEQWGNDTSISRIGSAWNYIKAARGTKGDKFVGIGVSKGATALLNYTRNNPANVAALLLIVPAVNVSDIHDNNRSGLAANIEAAYGGLAGWNAAKATHDPALNIPTHAAQQIPTRILYGDADTVCIPSTILSFGVGTGAELINIGSTLGHLDTAVAIDPVEDVWQFIAPYI